MWRAIFRLIVICTTTIAHALGVIVCVILTAWMGKSIQTRVRIFFVRSWAKTVIFVIGVRTHVLGPVPEPPFLLVSNHLSYLDIPIYFSLVRGIFVAKSEVGSWPLIGILTKLANTLFVDRRRRRDLLRVNALLERNMNRHQGVILFPEGTSTRGAHINTFKPSLLDTPARKGIPVGYATISYRSGDVSKPADLNVCWWGDMTFTDHFFRLLSIRYIDATVIFGESPIQNHDRKMLSQILWEHMNGQFQPVVTEPEA